MAIIKKKIWQEYFELVKSGKKRFELRLADFDIKEGDFLVLLILVMLTIGMKKIGGILMALFYLKTKI